MFILTLKSLKMQRIQIRFYLLRQVQSSISSISIHKFYSKRALSGTVFPITNRSIHGLSSLVAGKIVHVISAQLTAPNGTAASATDWMYSTVTPAPKSCELWSLSWLKVAPFLKYLQYNWLTSCTSTLNWNSIKHFNSESSLGFTQTTSLGRFHIAYFLLNRLTP